MKNFFVLTIIIVIGVSCLQAASSPGYQEALGLIRAFVGADSSVEVIDSSKQALRTALEDVPRWVLTRDELPASEFLELSNAADAERSWSYACHTASALFLYCA